MFAIAIDDAREDALYLARDRIGVKPLYVMDDGQRMLFASEIKAFWQVPSAPRSSSAIDLEAIHHYLTFNYIPAPWTAYQGVKHVMPGTWMKFTRGAPVQTRRWWSLADQREQDFGFDDWARNSWPCWTTPRAFACAPTCPSAPSCRAASIRAPSSA
jgi:asparagine synthase (glutamine-hydrolysing)